MIPGAEDANGFWWLLAGSAALIVLMLGTFAAAGWIGGRAERRAKRRLAGRAARRAVGRG